MWNLFVLVSRHSDELGLFENIGPATHRHKVTIGADFRGVYFRGNPMKLWLPSPECSIGESEDVGGFDNVDAWLVLVH